MEKREAAKPCWICQEKRPCPCDEDRAGSKSKRTVYDALEDMVYANPGLLEVLASIDGWLPRDEEIPDVGTGRSRYRAQWTLNAMRDWLEIVVPRMEPDEDEEPPGY